MLVQLSRYYNRSPASLDIEQVKHYLYHCREKKGLSVAFVNQTISAFKILKKDILGEEWGEGLDIQRPRRKSRLPEILSKEELRSMLDHTYNPKHKALIALMYSSGVRLQEFLGLRLADIDSDRMLIRIVNGKGGKDRDTILSGQALLLLRHYLRHARPRPIHYLFEGMGAPGKPYSRRSVASVIKAAAKRVGIMKNVTPHVLRHTCATHLLEQGTDLKSVQKLLGHSNLGSTMVYLHVSVTDSTIKSPLDNL